MPAISSIFIRRRASPGLRSVPPASLPHKRLAAYDRYFDAVEAGEVLLHFSLSVFPACPSICFVRRR